MSKGMKKLLLIAMFILGLFTVVTASSQTLPGRWSETDAKDWYRKQPWLVGSNYIPASAVNQLEMWQADSFNPAEIDAELRLAESLGMNTMRVFLHDLVWQEDPAAFKTRIDVFLQIAHQHHIKPIFVLFDSCWDPNPHLGKQPDPMPGIHNSRWLQSPGATKLRDVSSYGQLEAYVKDIIGSFAKDDRVLAWDVWNEPGNKNNGSYGQFELPNKDELTLALLPKVFEWARAMNPMQPLTSGVWQGNWSSPKTLGPIEAVQLENSDIISFHSYDQPNVFEEKIIALSQYNRPIICTEYMARGVGSTFQNTLPIAKRYQVGAINWGFVQGKTQTYLPWDSWFNPYIGREPAIWFHDIFTTTGQPYLQSEVDFIKQMMA